MIKNIVFDIGKVLVGYDWDAYLEMIGHGDKETIERLKDAMFLHGIWDEVDRGVWSEEELLAAFIEAQPQAEKEIREFWGRAGEALWQDEWTKPWISDLQSRGYRVFFLSNWSDHMRKLAADDLDFLPMMDGGVFSYEVNLIKPDTAIFLTFLWKYGLDPAECVFLDDLSENCEGARACGMHAIQVTDHDTAAAELEKFLV